MHLGNGAITAECAYLTLGVAAAGLAVAGVAARRTPASAGRTLWAGALCAAVFAAQMVNVPVLPFSSAHLVGGVLLAWCLGPALGALSMAVVLLVQALLLGDGGMLSLGANVINMALLPAGLVWLARRFEAAGQAKWSQALSVAALSGVSILLAAGLIVGEVALFRGAGEVSQLGPFAARMLGLHAWIGLGEGVATCAALFALNAFQPAVSARLGRWQLAGTVAAALVLVAFALPLATELPDGYESAAELSGLSPLLLEGGPLVGWQAALQSSVESALPREQLAALSTMGLAALLAAGMALATRVQLAPAKVRKHRDQR